MEAAGDTEKWKIGKRLEPTQRRFIPIIVRGKEQQGVKFWGFGKEIYQQLLDIFTDEDYGDITDPKNGKDIEIQYIPPKEAGNTYGKITFKVKPNSVPLTSDTTLLKKILTQQQNLIEIFKGMYNHSTQSLERALDRYLNPDKQVSTNGGNQVPQKTQNVNTGKPLTITEQESIDDVLASIDEVLDQG